MYSSCNLGFFLHIFTIFLANLVVSQVYGRETTTGVRTRRFRDKRLKLPNFGSKLAPQRQQWSPLHQQRVLEQNGLAPQCWTSEVAVLVAWILWEIIDFAHSEALGRIFYKKSLSHQFRRGKRMKNIERSLKTSSSLGFEREEF